MKKLLAVLLIFTAFAGCVKEKPVNPDGSPAQAAMSLNAQDSVIEYGESAMIISDNNPFFAYISYPSSIGFADKTIADWAQSKYTDAQNQINELIKKDSSAQGEINIQFDSYLVNNRYAGIIEKGMLLLSSMANPMDITETFNIDVKENKFLKNTDILDFSKLDSVLKLLRAQFLAELPDEGDLLKDISEKWLERILIGHNGIIVVLERDVHLPHYLGTQMITLPYGKLGASLKINKDTASKAPAPTPTATPKPSESVSPSKAPATIAPSTEPKRGNAASSKPMIALTFDDGPSKHTARVLDLLEKHKARATFFVVGNIVGTRKDVVLRTYNIGSEIGGHSWSHRDMTKLSEDELKKEINDTNNAVKAIIGITPKFYRPPYGAINNTVKSVSASLGQAMIYWSVDTLDWKTKNADAVYDAVMKNAADKAIILLHDLHGTTADAMERVIPALINKGYQLVTVSELMESSGKAMQPGVVYYNGK